MRELLTLMIGFLFFMNAPIYAYSNGSINFFSLNEQDSVATLPKVFLLGDHEDAYEQLSENGTSLLAICENDFNVAHGKWNSLLKEMEAHADMINYDIKGVKMWLHVFWDEKGKINHIAFYLKPNSRNIKMEEMSAFLTDFVNNYYVPIQFDENFSHYSGAAFPTLNWKRKSQTTAKIKE
jgi:hypothetical protein